MTSQTINDTIKRQRDDGNNCLYDVVLKNFHRADALSKASTIFYQHSGCMRCCILRMYVLKVSWYIQNIPLCARLYAVGKAIDNSQSCVRGSRKCETMFVNNSRANSWQPRLCGKPEAKWPGPTTGIYPVYTVAQTSIRINIPFEFDTICSPRWVIETSQYVNDRSKLDYIFRIQ